LSLDYLFYLVNIYNKMPFGIINYKKFNPFVKPTEEENALKEAYIVAFYNLKNPNNKTMLDNKENKYLHYDAIDKYETKYEIKSVNHIYNQFSGEYFPILKLYQHEYKNGLVALYHYLNDDIYYFNLDGDMVKNEWITTSKIKGMLYLPTELFKKV